MARISRLKNFQEDTFYHISSRTALPGFPLQDSEKDVLTQIMKKLSSIYFVEIIGFCIMGDHFHLLIRSFSPKNITDKQVEKNILTLQLKKKDISPQKISSFKQKWTDISQFCKELKQSFARFYNKKHNRKGYFWADRFKSTIVENGPTLLKILAYIDLNPLRAKLVERPEEYKWSSLGYYVQYKNIDTFLNHSCLGHKFKYREYVYAEAGLNSEKTSKTSLSSKVRYFLDALIIGRKKFVEKEKRFFEHILPEKKYRKSKKVPNFNEIYALKGIRNYSI